MASDLKREADAGAPLPWRVDRLDPTIIIDANENHAARASSKLTPRIIRAVNGFAAARERERALREALNGLRDTVLDGITKTEQERTDRPARRTPLAFTLSGKVDAYRDMLRAIDAARAALAASGEASRDGD